MGIFFFQYPNTFQTLGHFDHTYLVQKSVELNAFFCFLLELQPSFISSRRNEEVQIMEDNLIQKMEFEHYPKPNTSWSQWCHVFNSCWILTMFIVTNSPISPLFFYYSQFSNKVLNFTSIFFRDKLVTLTFHNEPTQHLRVKTYSTQQIVLYEGDSFYPPYCFTCWVNR